MAQNVTVAGASYTDVPSVVLPKTGGGTAQFDDTTDANATAADIVSGKTAYSNGTKLTGTHGSTITGTYDSSTKALTLTTTNVTTTWFGGINAEFLYEARCEYKLSETNYSSLTPTDQAQSLNFPATTYSSTAAANVTFDRYGNGYHSGTSLNYGVYNYIWLCEGFVQAKYTVDEATMGAAHVIASGFSVVYNYGSRPRVSSGNIIYPSTTTYGSYGNTTASSLMCYYRTAANVIALANNATYGTSLAAIGPSQSSTSSRTPGYVNFRTPTWGIRANDTYMPISSYSYLDAENTKLYYRCRFYRVPVEYGQYYLENDRLVRCMLLESTFPVELV